MLRSSDFDTFSVDVRYLLNYKAYNHQSLQSASSHNMYFSEKRVYRPWKTEWGAVIREYFVDYVEDICDVDTNRGNLPGI